MDLPSTLAALRTASQVLARLDSFDAPPLEEALRSTAAQLQLSGRQLFGALRVAVTGRTAAPPLFETMEVLGKERCLDRIGAAIAALGKG
jgi:glutamyl-tRNA synthetase